MKGCQIRALEDGKGIGIVSSEGKKGHKIPCRDISPGGVKIPIDFKLVARERGKDKNQWTNERRRRRGGGRSSRRRGGAGGGKNAGGGGKLSEGSIMDFFLLALAGRETQRQVDDKGKNDQADDADGGALCVHGNHC